MAQRAPAADEAWAFEAQWAKGVDIVVARPRPGERTVLTIRYALRDFEDLSFNQLERDLRIGILLQLERAAHAGGRCAVDLEVEEEWLLRGWRIRATLYDDAMGAQAFHDALLLVANKHLELLATFNVHVRQHATA